MGASLNRELTRRLAERETKQVIQLTFIFLLQLHPTLAKEARVKSVGPQTIEEAIRPLLKCPYELGAVIRALGGTPDASKLQKDHHDHDNFLKESKEADERRKPNGPAPWVNFQGTIHQITPPTGAFSGIEVHQKGFNGSDSIRIDFTVRGTADGVPPIQNLLDEPRKWQTSETLSPNGSLGFSREFIALTPKHKLKCAFSVSKFDSSGNRFTLNTRSEASSVICFFRLD